MNAFDILRRPVLSEKSYAGIPIKKYTFIVDVRADKTQIKAAIEEIYKVKVEKVNVVNVKGKFKKQGKTEGYTSKYKKAYVQLAKSSKPIEQFEGLV